MPQKKDHPGSGSAITGAGAVTAGAGLVGGGIPGFKSNSSTIADIRQGSWAKRTGAALSSGRGGVFGYRADAHQGFLNRQTASEAEHGGKPTTRVNHFLRGQGTGKIKPEVDIIRHMKRGRLASTGALVGGTAATAYGVRRTKGEVRKSQRDTDKFHGALLGTGGAAAAGSIGGARVLESQGRKWSGRAAHSIDEAAKIVPNMGRHQVKTDGKTVINRRIPDVSPTVTGSKVANDKKILAGKSKVQAEAAGKLRGAAEQQRYFAGVYGKTANMARKIRNPALAVAGTGAVGLALSRKKDIRKSADPRMSAFGVMH